MRARHPGLWQFVECWIRGSQLKSLLEIGGGDGYGAAFLDPHAMYLNIDPNHNSEACHSATICADWLTYPKSELAGKWDGVLAMNVIDSVKDPVVFMDGIYDVNPRVACITFWQPLIDGPENQLVEKHFEGEVSPGGGLGMFYKNRISRFWLTNWCEHCGIQWTLMCPDPPEPENPTTVLVMVFP